jgi:TolA-binding protein
MDTVTYPHQDVQTAIQESFVAVRFNERDPGPEGEEFLRTHRLLWSPGFVFLDGRGDELRRVVGFLPPEGFLAELYFALGMFHLLHTRYAESFRFFRHSADAFPQAHAAAEAIYWAGIAAFRRDGRKIEVIRKHWEELRERFPTSTWWTRADVF